MALFSVASLDLAGFDPSYSCSHEIGLFGQDRNRSLSFPMRSGRDLASLTRFSLGAPPSLSVDFAIRKLDLEPLSVLSFRFGSRA
ncbi:hypothetical protein BRARA_G02302 [Brassica rapa]|uniref:Uncharacterized protein n=1 Tax=Brassica campestris TaxID=3711 RepID=A0A397YNP3_BRACM|nr:hypothetical protein BRARA_G02302 [Brassica rapa]